MAEVTLSSKNQIVLPKEAREELGVKAGDKLIVTIHEGKAIILEKPRSHAQALYGLARGVYGKDYLKKERASWD